MLTGLLDRSALYGVPGAGGDLDAPVTALSYPLEAPHRRPSGQARHPRRRHPAPAVHRRHRSRDGTGHGRPTPYFQKYGENLWAAVRGYLDAVAEAAAAPVIQKYTGVLGAVDVFTVPTAFSILESIRLDLGYHGPGGPMALRSPG